MWFPDPDPRTFFEYDYEYEKVEAFPRCQAVEPSSYPAAVTLQQINNSVTMLKACERSDVVIVRCRNPAGEFQIGKRGDHRGVVG